MHTPSRRSVLTSGAALAAIIAAPARLRAAPREIVIGGPAGAAKYFNADLFPVLEKKLDCKVLYEGTNSLTNLQKMQADKAAPKISVVIMDDPVMLPAASDGLITKMSASSIANLGKLVDGSVHQDGMWANYQRPWAGIAYSTKRMKTAPGKWSDLWDAKYASRVIVPSLSNTEGFWTLLAAAHLETGKPYKEAQYEIDAAFKKVKELKANLLERLHQRAAGHQSDGAGRGVDDRRPVLGLHADPQGGRVTGRSRRSPGRRLCYAVGNREGEWRTGRRSRGCRDRLLPRARKRRSSSPTRLSSRPTNKGTPTPAGFPDPASLFAPDWAFVAKNRASWVDRWSKEMT